MVSVSAAAPVAATTRSGAMPAASSASSAFRALRGRERLAFAGRSERRDAVDALRQEPVRVPGEARVVDTAVAIERRQRRAPEAVYRVALGHG